jgi:hypothetical protein
MENELNLDTLSIDIVENIFEKQTPDTIKIKISKSDTISIFKISDTSKLSYKCLWSNENKAWKPEFQKRLFETYKRIDFVTLDSVYYEIFNDTYPSNFKFKLRYTINGKIKETKMFNSNNLSNIAQSQRNIAANLTNFILQLRIAVDSKDALE